MADLYDSDRHDDGADAKSYPAEYLQRVLRLHPPGPGVVQLGGDAARCLFQAGVKFPVRAPVSRLAVAGSRFYGALRLPDGRVVEAWKSAGKFPNVFLFDAYEVVGASS